MATTRSRPHGREQARPPSGGVAAEHATKIYAVAITGIVVIVAFLALTSTGHVIDAATQHFMLFYAGVFALIGLCASTGLGLIATDRVFLHRGSPGVRAVGPPGRILRRGRLPDHPHRHRDPRAARPRARRGGSVPVALPHLLHRPRHDRLGPHPPGGYNGHHAGSVQRARQGLAVAGDPLLVLRLVRVRYLARPARRASRPSPTWTGATGSWWRWSCSRSRCGSSPTRCGPRRTCPRRRWRCRRTPPPPRCAPRPCSPSSARPGGRTPAARTVSWSPRCRSRRCPRRSAEATPPVRC